jgi:hypothetical protein
VRLFRLGVARRASFRPAVPETHSAGLGGALAPSWKPVSSLRHRPTLAGMLRRKALRKCLESKDGKVVKLYYCRAARSRDTDLRKDFETALAWK